MTDTTRDDEGCCMHGVPAPCGICDSDRQWLRRYAADDPANYNYHDDAAARLQLRLQRKGRIFDKS